jgi:hypothetical protein
MEQGQGSQETGMRTFRQEMADVLDRSSSLMLLNSLHLFSSITFLAPLS